MKWKMDGPLVMVGVVLDRSTPESFAAFEAAIKKLSFILDCHLVVGDFDYFLKVRVSDIADLTLLLHKIPAKVAPPRTASLPL